MKLKVTGESTGVKQPETKKQVASSLDAVFPPFLYLKH